MIPIKKVDSTSVERTGLVVIPWIKPESKEPTPEEIEERAKARQKEEETPWLPAAGRNFVNYSSAYGHSTFKKWKKEKKKDVGLASKPSTSVLKPHMEATPEEETNECLMSFPGNSSTSWTPLAWGAWGSFQPTSAAAKERKIQFDRSRFRKYCEWKASQEQEEWINNSILGRPVLTEDGITDEYLAKELFNKFGPLDENSKQFKMILQNLREAKVEQIREWTLIRDEVLNEAYQNGIDPEYSSPSEMMLDKFTPEEIKSFNFNPSENKSKSDLLILPREEEFTYKIKFGRNNIGKRQRNYDNIDDDIPKRRRDENNGVSEEEKELFYYAIEQVRVPNTEFDYSDEYRRVSGTPRLRFTMMKLVEPFFLGIQLKELRKRFIKIYNYTSQEIRFSPFAWKDIFSDWAYGIPREGPYPKRLIGNNYNCAELFRPACLTSGICHQLEFLKRIWHLYLIVLHLKGPHLPIQTLPIWLKLIFGIDFKCRNWGFPTVKSFLEYLLQNWPRSGVEMKLVDQDGSNELMLVRIIKEKPTPKPIEEPQETKESGPLIPPSIPLRQPYSMFLVPKGYAGPTDCINFLEDFISPGMILRCQIGGIISASQLYVLLSGPLCHVYTFEKILAKRMGSAKKIVKHEAQARKEVLNPCGHLVACEFGNAWRRGITVSRDKRSGDYFQIFLIDECNHILLHISKIRYLPLDLLQYEAQAISCNFVIPPNLRQFYPKHRFEKNMRYHADRIFVARGAVPSLAVKFLERNTASRNHRWNVEITTMAAIASDVSKLQDIQFRLLCRSGFKSAMRGKGTDEINNIVQKVSGYRGLTPNPLRLYQMQYEELDFPYDESDEDTKQERKPLLKAKC